MKLGTLLLRDGVISLTQLQQGVKAQVLYGGRLGTNLVELGFLKVETLSKYLAKLRGVPEATALMLEAIDINASQLLSPNEAANYLAIPFAKDGDKTLVAVVDPKDDTVIVALTRKLGPIQLFVAPQLRILYYLEKVYQRPRGERFLRPASTFQRGPSGERRRYRFPASTTTTENLPVPPKRAEVHGVPPMRYIDAVALLRQARSRASVADTLIRFASGRFSMMALFSKHEDSAVGWRLYQDGEINKSLDYLMSLALPISGDSGFGFAAAQKLPFLGKLASDAMEARLWRALDLDTPVQVMILPILINGEVIGFIYIHSEKTLDDELLSEVTELAVSASDSMQKIADEEAEH